MLPLLPLREYVVFPHYESVPLFVVRARSNAIKELKQKAMAEKDVIQPNFLTVSNISDPSMSITKKNQSTPLK